nr:SMC-Scp complex subunit ScpB [Ferrovum sp.]
MNGEEDAAGRCILVLEAALLCSSQPLSISQLRRLFDPELPAPRIHQALRDLQAQWKGRGVSLVQVASGWRFQSAPWVQAWLERLEREPGPRYSRAVMETLAIIAWRQPVTRGDIEEIRGVTVSSPILKTLEERGWIEAVGQRETPGRPTLFGTTRSFLDHLGLRTLCDLPALDGLTEGKEDGIPALT